MKNLPPVGRIPENLDEMPPAVEIVSYEVQSWTPERDGKGRCTQVHFRLTLRFGSDEVTFGLRLQSADACDTLIAALQRHRNDVWPGTKS